MPILHSVIMTVMMEVMRLLSWSTPADTSELRPVVSRSLLLLAVTLPVATGSTVSAFASLANLGGAGRADRLGDGREIGGGGGGGGGGGVVGRGGVGVVGEVVRGVGEGGGVVGVGGHCCRTRGEVSGVLKLEMDV